jgi:MFS family permease
MGEPAPSSTNRKILPIFLIVLIDVLGLTIILPLLPFYAEKFGASPFVVGLLTSTYALCQLVSGPLLGRWSDTIGRKPLLLVSQFGTFLGFLLLAFSNSLTLIFISRVLDGVTAGNLSLAQAYIADVTEPHERAGAFAKIGIAFGVGFFIGPALTSALLHYGYSAPILGAAFLSACSMLATATLLPHDRPASAHPSHPKHRPALLDWSAFSRFFRRPELANLLTQNSIFFFSFSAYIAGFALFAERRFVVNGAPMGPRDIGHLFTYFGLLGIIIQGVLVGRLVKRFGERALALAAFVSCFVGYAFLSVIHAPLWILLTGLFTSFGNGVLRPVLTSEISSKVGRHEQGAVMGMTQSLNSIAQIIAPLVATSLIGKQLLSTWAWMPAALSALAVVLILRQRRRARTAG